MNKILVPTDFSNQALNAIKASIEIAKKTQAEIILLHILDLPSSQGSDYVQTDTSIPEVLFFKNAAEKKLTELAKSDLFDGIKVATSFIQDKTAQGVIKTAESNKVDLIVMGSHGISGAKGYFVGSNTQKVVRFADTPVLVIKGDFENFNIDKITFASDFSEGMKTPFKQALELCNILQAELDLLLINTPNSFKPTDVSEKILKDFLNGITTKEFSFTIYNDFSVEKGILKYMEKNNVDLVGIATHGRTGLAHFFNGSISEDLVNHSPKSILTFKVD